jgi:hypothetical protein
LNQRSVGRQQFSVCWTGSDLLSAQKISTLFWCTGWAWNWQIIIRFASIHGRACFILKLTTCDNWSNVHGVLLDSLFYQHICQFAPVTYLAVAECIWNKQLKQIFDHTPVLLRTIVNNENITTCGIIMDFSYIVGYTYTKYRIILKVFLFFVWKQTNS